MKLIQHVELSTNGGIVFTNIPNTFTDLFLLITARSTSTAAQWSDSDLRPNGSTSAITYEFFIGGGRDIRTVWQYWDSSATSGTNLYSNQRFHIANYASSEYKQVTADISQANNLSATNFRGFGGGIWESTNPITSLTLGTTGDSVPPSSATLYGILKGTGSASIS
jgi:hypothetical protein